MIFKSSKDFFKVHRFIWKCIGLIPLKKYRIPYLIWIFIFHFSVTFFYPLHLIIGLFKLRTSAEIFENLAISFTDILCSVKLIIIWYNTKYIWVIEDIFINLDARIQTKDEKIHFQKIVRNCKTILYGLGLFYSSVWLSSGLTALIGNQKTLMYPGWLPFDWEKSAFNYWIANMYQFIGISLQYFINYCNDTYPPLGLAVLSGHIRLLAIRLSKLGTDPHKSQEDNNRELKMCIKDHQLLIELYYVLSRVITKGFFFQIIITGFNLCYAIINLVFFADNIFSMMYYFTYMTALPFQIFPTCYYGSIFEDEFNNLPYAVFSSNWMDQNKQFKQSIIIFSQRSFQTTSFLCMGFLKIHLDSFYVTMKSAYSLFAVISQVK